MAKVKSELGIALTPEEDAKLDALSRFIDGGEDFQTYFEQLLEEAWLEGYAFCLGYYKSDKRARKNRKR